jgi:hypothetical protein
MMAPKSQEYKKRAPNTNNDDDDDERQFITFVK